MALSVAKPKSVLALWSAIVLLGLTAALDLRIDTTIGSALSRVGDRWANYERSLAKHGGDEFVSVVLPDDLGFSAQGLARVLSLTSELSKIEGVRRVDSLASVPLIREGSEQDVVVDPGLRMETLESDSSIEELARHLQKDSIAPGSLVSRDMRTLALNLVLGGDVDGDRELVVRKIREICSRIPGAVLSGVPVVRADAGARTRRELAIFVPATVLVVAVVIWVLFRQAVAVLVPLAVGGAGCVVCLGVMAASAVPLSFATALLPSVVLALACAYSMHVLWAARFNESRKALGDSIGKIATPVAVSGATTALGFLAMSSVGVDLIRDLATYGALAVISVNIATLTLAPAVLSLWSLDGSKRAQPLGFDVDALASGLVGFVRSRASYVVAGWCCLLVVFSLGLSRLHVASDVILWFPEGSELRDSYDHVKSRLSGITPINVLLEADQGESVVMPQTLDAIFRLASELRSRPEVGKVISIADPLAQIHQVFSGLPDRSLPSDPGLVDQYLLLLEGIEQIPDLLSADRSSANVLIRMDHNSSAEIVRLVDWVEGWWNLNGPDSVTASATGIMYEFGRAQDEIAIGGIRGLVLALCTIAGLMLVVTRSLGVALVSLIPNVVPIGIIFGFVGWLSIPLDAATVCVASLALGIGVDDTIHVVTGYQQRRREGLGTSDALRGCFGGVLGALVGTTFVIAVGFGLLGLSGFTLVRNLGLITAAVVVLCLLADLLFLPAILMMAERTRTRWSSTLK